MKKDEKDTEVEGTEEHGSDESLTRKEYKALIESYKKRNPVKYETKKAELEAKLNKLK